jgi:hypothetical protein
MDALAFATRTLTSSYATASRDDAAMKVTRSDKVVELDRALRSEQRVKLLARRGRELLHTAGGR